MARRGLRTWLAAAVAAAAALVLVTIQLPASADPVTGNATYFDVLGSPYGGCGLPQAQLDSQDFVALNVYNTPGDYNFYPRPLTGADAAKIGLWDNGLNCGRFVQVSIADYCTGVNDGAVNQPFCRNGSWTADQYNGATLTMIVADSCGDTNGWCRDDPYHLDLSKDSLNRFVKDGAAVGDLLPNHWNNRHVTWSFVPAPNYSGDIKIGFMQGAKAYWPAIAVSHLANGIHGVEYFSGGAWKAAKMNGDMGQSYVIDGVTPGTTNFQIRVRDVTGALINGGRAYSFALPSACGATCSQPYTATTYTTSDGSTSPASEPATPSPTPSQSPSPTPTVAAGSCSASSTVVSSWSGGFQSTVTVKAGTAPISGWSARWTFAGGEQITQVWSATATTSGATVTARNVAWNGALAANASTTFGYTASGTPSGLALTCTSP
jgi:cellulose binding protein with CBM2 domain